MKSYDVQSFHLMELDCMIKKININLSTIFHHRHDEATQEGVSAKQKLLNQKYDKVENRASTFLIDHKYSLKLDELI
jgi:hypothetical protein